MTTPSPSGSCIDRLALFPAPRPMRSPSTGWAGRPTGVYRVGDGKDVLCLRLPGKGTEEYINRRVEMVAAEATAKAGVSPEVLYFDPATGVMVTRFLADAVDHVAGKLRRAAGRAGAGRAHVPEAPRQRRGLRLPLRAVRDDRRLSRHARDAGPSPSRTAITEGLREAEVVRPRARRAPGRRSKPCHCDPLAENFLDTGERMWIVDWEYSGMNDPMWDLGDLSVEANLSPEAEASDARRLFRRARRPPSTAGAWSSTRRCATCCGRCGA